LEFYQLKARLLPNGELSRLFETLHTQTNANLKVHQMSVSENVFYLFPAMYEEREIESRGFYKNKRELDYD